MVYKSAGLSGFIRIHAVFWVLELILCFAGFEIETCNFDVCRGNGEICS